MSAADAYGGARHGLICAREATTCAEAMFWLCEAMLWRDLARQLRRVGR